MKSLGRGNLSKMRTCADVPVSYALPLEGRLIDMNALLGRRIAIRFLDAIYCAECGRKTRKSFSQGYCYPCSQSLARCDSCIMAPEKCHYDDGTCREPDWGERNCMIGHVVYLANSTGAKVGITRASQVPVRWMDQGAVAALPFVRTGTRYQGGLVEALLRQHITDRTHWQRLLKGVPEPVDLLAVRARLKSVAAKGLKELQERFGLQAVQLAADMDTIVFDYPVREYPVTVKSLALERLREVKGVLKGIKGQYLILSSGVINIRKYTSHAVELFAEEA